MVPKRLQNSRAHHVVGGAVGGTQAARAHRCPRPSPSQSACQHPPVRPPRRAPDSLAHHLQRRHHHLCHLVIERLHHPLQHCPLLLQLHKQHARLGSLGHGAGARLEALGCDRRAHGAHHSAGARAESGTCELGAKPPLQTARRCKPVPGAGAPAASRGARTWPPAPRPRAAAAPLASPAPCPSRWRCCRPPPWP